MTGRALARLRSRTNWSPSPTSPHAGTQAATRNPSMSAPMFNVSITRPAALPPKSTTSRTRPLNAVSSPAPNSATPTGVRSRTNQRQNCGTRSMDELGPAEGEELIGVPCRPHHVDQLAKRPCARLEVRRLLIRPQHDEQVPGPRRARRCRRLIARVLTFTLRGEVSSTNAAKRRHETDHRQVIAETEREYRDHRIQIAVSLRLRPANRRPQHERDQRRVERVHFGAGRSAPEQPIERQPERRNCCDDEMAAQPHEREEQDRRGRRAADRGHQVDPIGERSDGNQREQVGNNDIERIARRMRRAEHAADVLKLDGIAATADARVERQEIDHERGRPDAARCDETATAGHPTRSAQARWSSGGRLQPHAGGAAADFEHDRAAIGRDPVLDVGDPLAIDFDAALLNLSRRFAGRCGETRFGHHLGEANRRVGDDDVELWQVVSGKFTALEPRGESLGSAAGRAGRMKIRNDLDREVDLRLLRVQVAGATLARSVSISAVVRSVRSR